MPLYEFGCNQCGKEFEILCKNDEQPLCPHCGSSSTSRLMSCCAHKGKNNDSSGYATASRGGGCGGCSGGNCGSCGR